MCVKDTGTKYQLWISDFNIDGTFTRVHPFIISHTKTMTRNREDGKEEVFSACIKHDDTRYLGGNKSSSIVATKLQGRPRTGISYDNVRDVSSKLTNKIGIGVPIGNYLSQYFANLYLSELDHLCKEELKCKFYYRYADDIVILSHDKDFLHKVLIYIKLYVHTIGLKVKDNYQIYPVDSIRINFIRNGKAYYADSRDKTLFYSIHRLNHFPINFKIIKYDWRIYAKNRKENVKPQT